MCVIILRTLQTNTMSVKHEFTRCYIKNGGPFYLDADKDHVTLQGSKFTTMLWDLIPVYDDKDTGTKYVYLRFCKNGLYLDYKKENNGMIKLRLSPYKTKKWIFEKKNATIRDYDTEMVVTVNVNNSRYFEPGHELFLEHYKPYNLKQVFKLIDCECNEHNFFGCVCNCKCK